MSDIRPLKTFYGVDTSAEGFGRILKKDVPAKTYFYRFESKEEAELKFYNAYVKAYDKFKNVKRSFENFQKENDVRIDYFLDGDTHGLRHDMTISFNIDGFDFDMRMDGQHPLYDLDETSEDEYDDEGDDEDLEGDTPGL